MGFFRLLFPLRRPVSGWQVGIALGAGGAFVVEHGPHGVQVYPGVDHLGGGAVAGGVECGVMNAAGFQGQRGVRADGRAVHFWGPCLAAHQVGDAGVGWHDVRKAVFAVNNSQLKAAAGLFAVNTGLELACPA